MKVSRELRPILLLPAFWAFAFVLSGDEEPSSSVQAHPSVPEVVRTPDWPESEIDSVAAWRHSDGPAWIFASGKTSNEVYVCDANAGDLLHAIGQRPEDGSPLRRPNGLAVADDFLFVVERDNRRVQVFSLPELASLGIFGGDELWYPYGIDLHRVGDAYEVYVTDNYGVDPDSEDGSPLDLRVKHFRVFIEEEGIAVTLEKSFGATEGRGILHEVESILVDADADRVYLCDERELSVKVYRLDGTFTGTIIGEGTIEFEPEGLILVKETPIHPGGVLVVTDQGDDQTVFRVYSIDSGKHLGSFTGASELANTDGICFLPGSFGPFERGALYAVHNDFRVQGYSWADVEALFTRE